MAFGVNPWAVLGRWLLPLPLAACGGDDPDREGAVTDMVPPRLDGAADMGEPGTDTYAPGLAKTGEHLRVILLDARPAPPQRGDENQWRVAIETLDGQRQSGCELDVTPFMPVHQHGSGQPDVRPSTEPTEPGVYDVGPINLFMPQLWEFTFEVSCAELKDVVKFAFFVER